MLAAESQPVVAIIKRERLSSPACGAQAGAAIGSPFLLTLQIAFQIRYMDYP